MKPLDVHKQFANYLKQGDLEGLTGLFHEQAVFIPGPNRKPAVGRKAIAKELEVYLRKPSKIETKSTTVHINGDLALVKSEWEINSKQGKIFGTALEVLKKVNGKWLFFIDSPYGV